MFPKSLREVQSSDAEPSEAPRAVTPKKAQLSSDSSEWEVRVQPATEMCSSVCDGVPGHISRYGCMISLYRRPDLGLNTCRHSKSPFAWHMRPSGLLRQLHISACIVQISIEDELAADYSSLEAEGAYGPLNLGKARGSAEAPAARHAQVKQDPWQPLRCALLRLTRALLAKLADQSPCEQRTRRLRRCGGSLVAIRQPAAGRPRS